MNIGARTIKTGLAVALSIFICNLFNLQPSIFAGAVTVLVVQPSIGLSITNAKEQGLAHVLSIVAAVVLGLSLGSHPLNIALATIVVILTCQHFRWKSGLTGGIMAAIFILGSPHDQFLSHAMLRSLTILIGVVVGLVVNIVIAPPRYSKLLQEKFVELNTLVSQTFFQAVQSFISLAIPAAEDIERRAGNVENLFMECQRLYEILLVDRKSLLEKAATEEETGFLREYLTYNRSLWQRGLDIFVLARERQVRRKEAGNLPISTEYQEILDLVKGSIEQFDRHNHRLQEKLQGKTADCLDEFSVWGNLDQAINNWHEHFPSGSYYRHALIGVSLVTDKTRWADKEALRMCKALLVQEKENQTQ